MMAFCRPEEEQCVDMGGGKKKRKEKAIKLVTGRQEVMAVLQLINLFLNLNNIHLNTHLSPLLATNTHTPQ